MSLDINVFRRLDKIVNDENVGWNVKDGEALDYLNKLRFSGTQTYIALEYRRYYFKAKQHIIEERQEDLK